MINFQIQTLSKWALISCTSNRMEGLEVSPMWRDVRHAIRLHMQNKAFTTVAVLTLALGTGLSTAIFGLVYGLAIKPQPYRAMDQLAEIASVNARRDVWPLANTELQAIRNSSLAFDDVATYLDREAVLTGIGEATQVSLSEVSANFFPLLGVAPIIGRAFTADDGNGNLVVLLNEQFWRAHLAADPGIVGRSIVLDGRRHVVIGIMAAAVQY